jgi:hypothetical protein
VKNIAAVKIGQVAAKYGEQAPVVTACCNACRTCVQTNLVVIAVGTLAAVGTGVKRFFARSASSS